DFTARRGLRDRACEGLAWRGAAARIGIVADAGNPGARRLCTRRRHGAEACGNERKQGQKKPIHGVPLSKATAVRQPGSKVTEASRGPKRRPVTGRDPKGRAESDGSASDWAENDAS